MLISLDVSIQSRRAGCSSGQASKEANEESTVERELVREFGLTEQEPCDRLSSCKERDLGSRNDVLHGERCAIEVSKCANCLRELRLP